MSAISQLTPLLPSTPYLLAYTLPLLLISLLLTFAGTFLTLDRSRTFPPAKGGKANNSSYASLSTPAGFDKKKPKKKFTWVFEGGLGGMAGGYAFGIHFSTALALLIPGTTPTAPLSPKAFLAIWILTCSVATPLAARYRYAAFTFLGISGGTLIALAFCIAAHPSLQSRITLTAVFLPLFTVLILLITVLPASRLTYILLHPLLRICTASTGAFGIIFCVALLMNPQQEGWANAWERLWMTNSPTGPEGQIIWGSSQEQGLSAGFAVFLFAGIAVDWALRRWIGECPDEKWDNYLAKYTASLPHEANRAGSFKPFKPFLERFFSSDAHTTEKDILFPNDVDMKTALTPPLPVLNMHNNNKPEKDIELTSVPAGTELLKKKRSKKVRGWKLAHDAERKGRKPVKFGEVSDSSEDEADAPGMTGSTSSFSSPPSQRRGIRFSDLKPGLLRGQTYQTSSSTPTLVDQPSRSEGKRKEPSDQSPRVAIDYEQEIAQLKERLRRRASETPTTTSDVFDLEYSDYEDDIIPKERGLLRRASLANERNREAQGWRETRENWSPGLLERLEEQAPMVPAAVPATPSLIKALDRLALAQRDAYGAKPAPSPLRTEAPPASEGASRKRAPVDGDEERGRPPRSPRWEDFWREVRDKAQP